MITITNGATTITVTRGAYKTLYKASGYAEVKNEAPGTEPGDGSEDDGNAIKDTGAEIPPSELGGMDLASLKAYAAEKGIAATGLRTRADFIAAIKARQEAG